MASATSDNDDNDDDDEDKEPFKQKYIKIMVVVSQVRSFVRSFVRLFVRFMFVLWLLNCSPPKQSTICRQYLVEYNIALTSISFLSGKVHQYKQKNQRGFRR